MKRTCFIAFVALSTWILLMAAAIPHHHHEGVACMLTEHCTHDNVTDEEDTHHHSDAPARTHCHTFCIAEADFITPSSKDEIKYKESSGHHSGQLCIPLLSVCFLTANFLNVHTEYAFSKPEYGEYLSFYQSTEIARIYGLRAPPYIYS